MKTRMTLIWAATAALVSVFTTSARAEDSKVDVFVHGDKMQGIHGIVAGADGQLYVGSNLGQSVYKVDPKSGATSVWQGPPLGMADDLVFAPDGRLFWTSLSIGKLHARLGDGPVQEVATGLPGINSLDFTKDGRLFVTQVFLGDALYEIDPAGKKPPRQIMKDLGGLNGFEFGKDGLLYGPLWFKGQIVKIDVDKGTIAVVADGFKTPSAVNFGPDGVLYALEAPTGEVFRVDPATGQKSLAAKLRPGLDNLCFNAQGTMYVTGMADAAVYEVDYHTGKSRTIREAPLVAPTDLAVFGDTLYVADSFALRSIDLRTRAVTTISRAPELEYAFGIDVSERYIHTASWFNSAVQTFDRKTGALLHTYHKLPMAYDVLEADDGSLLVLQMSPGTISRLSPEEGKAPQLIASGLAGATALARAGKDAAYVTLYAKGEVVSVDLKTGVNTPVANGLNQPEGIAVAKDGRILVVEGNAGRVVAIDPKSGAKTELASGLSLAITGVPGFPPMLNLNGVAAGPDGSIYLGSEKESAIIRVTK